MATAVLQRPKELTKEQQTGTWGKIFPNEQITETQSALFVKKLLAIAVSNIAYLRAIFPEHAFGDRSLEGLNLKILKDDIACPGASQVIKWMRGCFDAFDKKYLRMLMIGLYIDPNDPDTVIESYSFKFSYKDDGGIDIYRNNEKISGAHSESETRKATIQLLRTIIILTQTLESLPDDVMMTMKLLYYDDVTPTDYEPPGFMSAENDNFAFEDEPMTINVGDVATPYHCIKVRVKTDKKQFEMTEGEPAGSQVEEEKDVGDKEIIAGLDEDTQWQAGDSKQEDAELIDGDTGEEVKVSDTIQKEPSTDAEVPSKSPAKPGLDGNAVEITGSQTSQVSEGGDEYKVRCPCGCNEDDGLMVLCAVCKLWQHGVCFLIVDEDDAPEHHVCDVCAVVGEKDKEPTDYYLTELTPIEIQATCLWRRTLVACMDMNKILAPLLAKRLGTEMTVAVGLMNRLDKEGFLKSAGKGKKQGKAVDKAKITSVGIPKYMKRMERPAKALSDTSETRKEESPAEEKMEVQNDELDSLAKKTGELKINPSKEKLSRKKKKLHTEKMLEEIRKSPRLSVTEERREKTKTQQTESENDIKRRGRKRAISKRDEGQEFDVCYSQDIYEEEPKRERKASRVTRDIMVRLFSLHQTQQKSRYILETRPRFLRSF